MNDKWKNIQVKYNGGKSDINDLIIHYHKEIDGKMYYIKEQGGKILYKTLLENIVR